METRHVFILILLLSLFDLVAINCAYAATSFVYATYSHHPVFNYNFFLFINISWFTMAVINRLYKYTSVQTIKRVIYKSLLTYSCQVLLITICVANVSILKVSDDFMFYFLLVEFLGLTAIRQIIYLTQKHYDKLADHRQKIAIVGYNEASERLATFFQQNKLSYNFAGHYKRVNEYNVEARLDDLKNNIRYAAENRLNEVYTTLFPENCEGLSQVIDLAEKSCIRVRFITTSINYKQKLASDLGSNYNLTGYYAGIPILGNRPEPLSTLKNRIIKRAFDIIFSLGVTIFLLSWLMPLMALIIKIESRGPLLFMQLRSGRNNKPFWCYKFRSMRVNDQSNSLQATKNDARVTKVGAFIRKYSIDELPQFFNVLQGNMSVVGPRPHMLKHTDEYSAIIDQYMVRLFLKPGITGWAQVNGHRGETRDHEQMRHRVEHDIWYMENWNLLQDLKIILQTVSNAAGGEKNAY